MRQKQKQKKIDITPPMGVRPIKSIDESICFEKDGKKLILIEKYYLLGKSVHCLIELDIFPFTIGRLSNCSLTIMSRKVSNHQASITRKNNALVIVNEDIEYNIKVNKHKVQQVILRDGDEIDIADETYYFVVKRTYKAVAMVSPPNEKNSQIEAIPASNISNKATIMVANDIVDNVSKNTNEKRKLAGFTFLTVLLMLSVVVTYQYYQQQVDGKRAFLISNNEEIDNKSTPAIGTTTTKSFNNSKQDSKVETLSPITPVKQSVPKAIASIISIQTMPAVSSSNTSTVSNKLPNKNGLLLDNKKSKQQIIDAMDLFHTGHFAKASKVLTEISNYKRHSSEYRAQARQLNQQIMELNTYYLQGKQALANNNEDEVFLNWQKLLSKNKQYFPNRGSSYISEIKLKVAGKFEQSGNEAYVNKEWAKAYQYWKNSIIIRPKESIQQAIKLMDEEIKELYLTGYRYETVDINRSLDYWNKLINKAPRDHQYYTKAAAKIQWYSQKH